MCGYISVVKCLFTNQENQAIFNPYPSQTVGAESFILNSASQKLIWHLLQPIWKHFEVGVTPFSAAGNQSHLQGSHLHCCYWPGVAPGVSVNFRRLDVYFPMFPSFPPLPCLSPASNLHPFMDSATVALLCAEHWAGHRIQGDSAHFLPSRSLQSSGGEGQIRGRLYPA